MREALGIVTMNVEFSPGWGGGGGGGMSHWGLYIIRVNHFLKSTLNEDEVLGNFDTLYRDTIGQLWFLDP